MMVLIIPNEFLSESKNSEEKTINYILLELKTKNILSTLFHFIL